MYTLREFRAKTKEAFDLAQDGDRVRINRNGVMFELRLIEPMVVQDVLDFKGCKHGYDPKFCRFAKPGKPCK